MNRAKQFLEKWKTEYDFKTFAAAFASLAVTVLFALYNGFLGIWNRSLWHGAICMYYLLLVLLRGLIVSTAKKYSRQDRQEKRNKAFLTASALLLALNLSLILPISMLVTQQKPVSLTLIPAISMATYTTYKVTMASVNLKKRKISSDNLVWLLRTINFVDALVSILTLQNTLIMVHSSGGDLGLLPLSAASSAVIWVAVLILSVFALRKGIKVIRQTDK